MNERDLNRQIVSGMVWKFAERFLAQVVSFIVSLVLARILTPSDYGIVSIVTIFIALADVFLSSGLNTALIQKRNADETDFSTIFWCNLLLGVVLYAILFVMAPCVAKIYNMPVLISVIRVFALRLPISAFQSIQNAYVSRRMEFKKFFCATLTGTLVSAVLGIFLAIHNFGVWALIAQYMSNTVIDTLFLFGLVKWLPKKDFSWHRAKPLIQYSMKIMITDLVGTIFNNLGDFMIGLKFTSSDLAYYTKGKQLPMLVKTNIFTAMISVLFPGMSQINDTNEKVKMMSKNSMICLTYIIYPLMIGLAIVAEPLTLILYTKKWLMMVPFIRIVCLEAVLSVPATISLQAIKAMGRSDMMLKAEYIKKPILLLSFIVAVNRGVIAVAWVLPINTIVECVINAMMMKKVLDYGFGEQLKDCAPAAIMSAIMGWITYEIGFVDFNIYFVLFLQISAGILIYIALSVISKNKAFTFIKKGIVLNLRR